MPGSVSLTTIVRNEAARLPEMIRSARHVAGEFVLVDTGSTDGTPDLARRLGCRVLETPWCDDFSAARNVGLDACRGEWIVVLDADDRLLGAGVAAVRRAVRWGRPKLGELGVAGYSFSIREETASGEVLGTACSSGRLFPRQHSLRYGGRVHETVHYLPDPDRRLRWALLPGIHIRHLGYDPDLMAAKYARNKRLLKLSLEDDPNDVYAQYYLATQARSQGQVSEAVAWASRALHINSASDRLLPEHRAQLREIVRGITVR